MRQLRKILVLAAFVGMLAAPPAMAMSSGGGTGFSVLGGVNYGVNNYGALGYTGGAAVNLALGSKLYFDIGGEYLSRSYSILGFTGSNQWAQFPATLRVMLGNALSLGGGVFYDTPITAGVGTSYGAQGVLRVDFPGSMFFVKANYDYQLGQPAGTTANQELQGLLGIHFGGK